MLSCGSTSGLLRKARDTVGWETPARCAISTEVGLFLAFTIDGARLNYGGDYGGDYGGECGGESGGEGDPLTAAQASSAACRAAR